MISYSEKYRKYIIIVSIATTVSITIFLSLFFAIIFQDIEAIEESHEGNCNTTKFDIDAYRCCDKTWCICTECHAEDTCENMLNNLYEGECCNGYQCCYSACDKCTRNVEESYSCNCDAKGACSTCTRTRSETYDCNCGCKDWVDDETCSITCGTCYKIESTLKIETFDEKSGTHIEKEKCGRDDEDCVNKFTKIWDTNEIFKKCWWHDEEDKIYWEEPSHDIVAIIFCGIFGLTTLVFPTILGIHWYLNR